MSPEICGEVGTTPASETRQKVPATLPPLEVQGVSAATSGGPERCTTIRVPVTTSLWPSLGQVKVTPGGEGTGGGMVADEDEQAVARSSREEWDPSHGRVACHCLRKRTIGSLTKRQ